VKLKAKPMPIQHAIWKIGETPEMLPVSALAKEQILEDMITADAAFNNVEEGLEKTIREMQQTLNLT
jgi:hypothetical protein